MCLEIGIIGYGRFGRFAAGILKKDFRIVVFDRRPLPRQRGIKVAPLAEVASRPVLLLCVPISEIESICRKLQPLLKAGQLVVDACSVKEKPLKAMKELLPRNVEILGTHPLFGPDSARRGIRGLRMVLCPVRCRRLTRIMDYLRGLGLEVIVTSAVNHDRQMAHTQALFHFLARAVGQMDLKVGAIATPGPARMFREFQEVRNDSPQLFLDMQRNNRFSALLRRELIEKLIRIDKDLTRPARSLVKKSGRSA